MSWNNLFLPFAVDHDLYPYRSADTHDSWDTDSQSFSQNVHPESPADHAPISSPHSMHVPPTPSSSPTSVKIEPDDPDSRFIMELAAFPPQSSSSSRSSPDSYAAYNDSQPPTEVPLRATQASKEMRRMMGVFRLNPFAMHSLSRGGDNEDSPDPSPTGSATWCGEAGPLDEEPVMFEFQLDISGLDREDDGPVLHAAEPSSRLPAISAHDESQLRAFSPSFELHEGDLSEGHEGASSSTRYNIQRNVDQQQPMPEKDPGTDFRQVQCDPWEEADYAPHAGSDSGTSSSTTVSVRTPLNESSCSPFDNGILAHMQDHLAGGSGCAEQTQTSPIVEFPSTPLWDVPEVPDDYQVQEGPGADPNMNYGHQDTSRGGIVHPNTHQFMRVTYQTPYARRTYAQPNGQFQQAQGQPNFFLSMPTNHSPYNAPRPGVQDSSPSQEIEHVPQSPSTLSPLSPATPNSLQYNSLNQQHSNYQSQHPSPSHHQPQHHQMPVYSASNPVTPTSMPLRLPISIARSAMRSATAFSNAGSPTSCHSQLPPLSPYNMHSSGRGYRVSRRPHLEERIGEHEVYSTPHSPVTEDHRERYIPSTPMVNMGVRISAPMHPVLQRSSTYTGGHPVPQLVNGAVAGSAVHGHANTNNRRWSLPEMSVGAYAPAVSHSESFLGHHM